jgi:hypothetical protein
MPEQPVPPPAGIKNDLIGSLAAKFGEQAIARFFGNDVPESDKAAILDDLVNTLSELTVINRYFAEQMFNKFGDEETGELRRKPDIRDFLTCWTEATIRLMAEEEIAKAEDSGEGGEANEGGEAREDGEEGTEGEPPARVIDVEFRRK